MTILPHFTSRPTKKKVSWCRRHHAWTALTRIMVRKVKNLILGLCRGMEICKTQHRKKTEANGGPSEFSIQ